MNVLATRRGLKYSAGALVLAATLAACGSSSSKSSTTTAPGGTSGGPALSGTLTGSGSTFQTIFQQALINGFKSVQSGITVTYDATGSTAGKKAIADGTSDFGGTDSLIKDTEKSQYNGKTVLYFPIAGGPIAVAFNVSGLDKVQLSPATLAGIFMGKIKTWNDSAIKADNPGATLPSTDITIVHRSDGSGTTSNFTKYLAKAAPTVFTLTPGDTVDWPAGSQGAAKNAGVATAIGQTNGAVGYVDYSTTVASNLKSAAIKNAAGEYQLPTLAGATKALDAATVAPDLTFSPLDQPGAGVYPITAPTWMIAFQKQTNAAKGNLLKAYLAYVLGAGQQLASPSYYAPLPKALDDKAVAQIAMLQVG